MVQAKEHREGKRRLYDKKEQSNVDFKYVYLPVKK